MINVRLSSILSGCLDNGEMHFKNTTQWPWSAALEPGALYPETNRKKTKRIKSTFQFTHFRKLRPDQTVTTFVTTFSQHLLRHVVTCCEMLRPCQVKRPQQPLNISRTNLEMLWRCWDKVWMNSNSSQHDTTPHNIVERGGQTVSTSALNKCWENVLTNVMTAGSPNDYRDHAPSD